MYTRCGDPVNNAIKILVHRTWYLRKGNPATKQLLIIFAMFNDCIDGVLLLQGVV